MIGRQLPPPPSALLEPQPHEHLQGDPRRISFSWCLLQLGSRLQAWPRCSSSRLSPEMNGTISVPPGGDERCNWAVRSSQDCRAPAKTCRSEVPTSGVHRLDDVAASRWLRVTVPVSGNQAHQHDERSLVRRRIPPTRRRSLIRRVQCSPPWTTCTRALCGARLRLDNGSGKLGQRRASAGLLRLLI